MSKIEQSKEQEASVKFKLIVLDEKEFNKEDKKITNCYGSGHAGNVFESSLSQTSWGEAAGEGYNNLGEQIFIHDWSAVSFGGGMAFGGIWLGTIRITSTIM